jgi:hypothetical protein
MNGQGNQPNRRLLQKCGHIRCEVHREDAAKFVQYGNVSWPPLWSSGQSSWLQIRRPGFDSRHYQIFWKKKSKTSSGSGTGSTQPREYNWGATWYKSGGSGLENREYGRRDPSHWPRGTLYPQKLAITSPTSGGRSVGIVRLRTQTMEFICFVCYRISHSLISIESKGFWQCCITFRITVFVDFINHSEL